jgi:hypothetical protein
MAVAASECDKAELRRHTQIHLTDRFRTCSPTRRRDARVSVHHANAGRAGFPILMRIAKNAGEHVVKHRVVFGFSSQSAGQLVERPVLGRGGPPVSRRRRRHRGAFARPSVRQGRAICIIAVGDRELADSLAEGFHELWRKAMKNLREIQVDPRGRKS